MNNEKHIFNDAEINERFLALACRYKLKFNVSGKDAKREASRWMLMHEKNGLTYFKNINTRQYIDIDCKAVLKNIRDHNKRKTI
jgi:hypothetical protein